MLRLKTVWEWESRPVLRLTVEPACRSSLHWSGSRPLQSGDRVGGIEGFLENIRVDLADCVATHALAVNEAGIVTMDSDDVGAFLVAEDFVPLALGVVDYVGRCALGVAVPGIEADRGAGTLEHVVLVVNRGAVGHPFGYALLGYPFEADGGDAALGVARESGSDRSDIRKQNHR